jgi:ankyrin repeat protein
VDVAELLISKGADVSARATHPDNNSTPLHLAALNNHREVADLLISKGADVTVKARFGPQFSGTPLDWATEKGSEDVAELLRQQGGVRLPTPTPS